MEQRVSLVTLGVLDVPRARRFYEALGWRVAGERRDDVAFFQCGCLGLALWSAQLLAEDSGVAPAPGGRSSVTLAHNVASPEEVDEVLEEAVLAGGHLARGGAPTAWGGYSGVFHDPDGHPWEVAHNPHWDLLEDGSVRLETGRS